MPKQLLDQRFSLVLTSYSMQCRITFLTATKKPNSGCDKFSILTYLNIPLYKLVVMAKLLFFCRIIVDVKNFPYLHKYSLVNQWRCHKSAYSSVQIGGDVKTPIPLCKLEEMSNLPFFCANWWRCQVSLVFNQSFFYSTIRLKHPVLPIPC